MRVIKVASEKRVLKTKEEKEKELQQCKNDLQRAFVSDYKVVDVKNPTYIVEMTAKELQLVSFYLELEKRKPIINVEIKKEKKIK